MKFSDWQGHHSSGMRRACLLSGVGVDGHMGGRAAHYTVLVLYCVAHGMCYMCNVHISGSFSVMCTWY